MKKYLIALFFVLGCTGKIYFEPRGSLSVTTNALTVSDISRVEVTVTGANIPTSIVYDLTQDAGAWVGILGDIPLGAVTVTVDAYNVANNKIYTGSNTTTIVADTIVSVTISLQQVTPPTPFTNVPPVIDSLIASSNAVKPSTTVNLFVTAHDPDGDPLTYAWTATGGTFDNSSSQTPIWTAPVAQTNYTITINVSDNRGGSRTASIIINVDSDNTGGGIGLIIDLNTSPVVSGVTAIPARVNVNETTQLNISASDPDSDPLTYSWADTGGACAGTFNNGSIFNPTWTAPSSLPAAGKCILTCTVTDGQGGSNSGSVTVYVAVPDPFNLAPYLSSSYQQKTTVNTNGNVKFKVNAKDPENQTMTFAWSSSRGSLSVPISHSKDSEVTWTAPGTAGVDTITVTVTDSGGAQLIKNFSVTVN
jgi:hypothetical protein